MATSPVKSQPLHNFSLSFLKWGHKNQVINNHRFRRPPSPGARNPSPPAEQQQIRLLFSERAYESESDKRGMITSGSRTTRNRFSLASCSLKKQQQQRQEEQQKRQKNNGGEGSDRSEEGGVEKQEACEEGSAKPLNLRPRKMMKKTAVEIGAGSSNNGELQKSRAPSSENSQPKSMRLRGFMEGQGSERKEKKRFWISLSREEIEEDVYALTGAKPSRRPKKRPRIIQKQLDNVFPGLYLVGVSADSFRVHDAS